jgi:potassium-transporting ATPase KdpC subunit
MSRTALRALIATILFALITGLLYPLAMTAFATIVFPRQAQGSLVSSGGTVVGSRLIGQRWMGPSWFQGRPSASSYDASASGGSNLGPNSRQLAHEIRARAIRIVRLERPYAPGLRVNDIPVDLLTASASGLDPDISPAAADLQAARIAAVDHLSMNRVMALIDDHTRGRTFGVLGEPRVNVLELNLALAAMKHPQG